jgi:hypothetical protein
MHGAQLPAQRLLADPDRERVPNPLRQIDQPPAHDTMQGRGRTIPDDLRQGPALSVIQQSHATGRNRIDQSARTRGVEPQHPIANRLKTDATDPRRRATCAAFLNHRQCQQPTNLVRTPA